MAGWDLIYAVSDSKVLSACRCRFIDSTKIWFGNLGSFTKGGLQPYLGCVSQIRAITQIMTHGYIWCGVWIWLILTQCQPRDKSYLLGGLPIPIQLNCHPFWGYPPNYNCQGLSSGNQLWQCKKSSKLSTWWISPLATVDCQRLGKGLYCQIYIYICVCVIYIVMQWNITSSQWKVCEK